MSILDWIFPPRCAGCRSHGSAWCVGCAASLAPIITDWRVGVPMIAAGRLAGPWQRAIHEFKYGSRPQLAKTLAQPLGAAVAARIQLDTLVAIPLHQGRQRERGFNQSERLARELAPVLRCRLAGGLRRARATVPQVGLDEGARRANMAGAFRWEGPPPRGPVGLVDDVYTTGATIEAAAAALALAGVPISAVLVLAVRTGSPTGVLEPKFLASSTAWAAGRLRR